MSNPIEKISGPLTRGISRYINQSLYRGETAPQVLLNKLQSERTFLAVIKRSLGDVTSEEFLMYARRLVSICDDVYQGSQVRLVLNDDPSLELDEYNRRFISTGNAQTVDINSPEGFKNIFIDNNSVTLRVDPALTDGPSSGSFAQMRRTKDSPKVIIFNGQDRTSRDPSNLVSSLYEKMFFVEGSAPTRNTDVLMWQLDYTALTGVPKAGTLRAFTNFRGIGR